MKTIKLYAINTGVLAISFSHAEVGLKIVLLLVTIGYTISKWIGMYSKKEKK